MESLDYSSFAFLPTLITSIVTGAITWLGTFIFYKQKRDGMDISNEAQRSAEWKKLYDESKQDSDNKDQKIDELRKEINDLRNRMIDMERQIQLNGIYRCEVLTCNKRRPPMAEKPRNARGQFVKRINDPIMRNDEDTDDALPEDAFHSEQPDEPEPPMA